MVNSNTWTVRRWKLDIELVGHSHVHFVWSQQHVAQKLKWSYFFYIHVLSVFSVQVRKKILIKIFRYWILCVVHQAVLTIEDSYYPPPAIPPSVNHLLGIVFIVPCWVLVEKLLWIFASSLLVRVTCVFCEVCSCTVSYTHLTLPTKLPV